MPYALKPVRHVLYHYDFIASHTPEFGAWAQGDQACAKFREHTIMVTNHEITTTYIINEYIDPGEIPVTLSVEDFSQVFPSISVDTDPCLSWPYVFDNNTIPISSVRELKQYAIIELNHNDYPAYCEWRLIHEYIDYHIFLSDGIVDALGIAPLTALALLACATLLGGAARVAYMKGGQ